MRKFDSAFFGSVLRAFSLVALFACVTGCDDSVVIATSNGGVVSGGTGGSGGESSGSGVIVAGSSTGSRAAAALGSTAECTDLTTTTPRGISCLHCLHDRATEQSFELVKILNDSCLENVALSYLVDGSFGSDFDRIVRHVDSLTSEGRRVFVHFYLLNGPSQRQWKDTTVVGSFTRMSPENFRKRIVTDRTVRARVVELVDSLSPTLRSLDAMGAVISLVPMLEDNLTEKSFIALSDLVLESLPNDIPISMGRNPCSTCYRSNDDSLPEGFFLENHSRSTSGVTTDGVFSNDGTDVSLRGGGLGNRVISTTQLSRLVAESENKNSIFLFWNAEYQGLKSVNGAVRGTDVAPSKRRYAFPTQLERLKIIGILRGE